MLEAGFDLAAEGSASPGTTAERRETKDELATALLALPPAVRSAVVLRHVDGLSVAETAEALGRPVGTIKAQVHRGLHELRAILESRAAASAGHAEIPVTTRMARPAPVLEARA
jgi:DNA-directed RNA polymerase specialized sigma24 family protein